MRTTEVWMLVLTMTVGCAMAQVVDEGALRVKGAGEFRAGGELVGTGLHPVEGFHIVRAKPGNVVAYAKRFGVIEQRADILLGRHCRMPTGGLLAQFLQETGDFLGALAVQPGELDDAVTHTGQSPQDRWKIFRRLFPN